MTEYLNYPPMKRERERVGGGEREREREFIGF